MTLRNPGNVLVTGGCGFIGSAFVRYLLQLPSFTGRIVNVDKLTYAGNPDNVANLPTERHRLAQVDICDQDAVTALCQSEQIGTIVHFAAESHVDRSILGPMTFIETNLVGTAKLLEVVRHNPSIHFHHVSTDEVFGSLGETGLFTETTPYDPRSPYSASKAGSDHLVRAYGHTFGLSHTVSNCSNNYGPFQFPEKLVPLMILNMLERKPLPIYGDGGNIRDWLHVDDHVEAIWKVVTEGASGATYNIGGRSERTNLQLIDLLIDLVAAAEKVPAAELHALKTYVKDRPGHDRRYAIDASKIEAELGWKPRYTLEGGMADTVQWFRTNAEWIDRVRSGAYRKWLEQNYSDRS